MVVLARRKQGSCGLSEGKGQFQVNQSKGYIGLICVHVRETIASAAWPSSECGFFVCPIGIYVFLEMHQLRMLFSILYRIASGVLEDDLRRCADPNENNGRSAYTQKKKGDDRTGSIASFLQWN